MAALRLIRIAWAFWRLLLFAAWQRLRGRPGEGIPARLRSTLERLGPTVVKMGQALSMRRDVLPDAYVIALHELQEQVAPFPEELARREIERGLAQPMDTLFDEFEPQPFAAASIAQVH
jgi:ubiquinone biosynthesis protein